MPKKNFPATDLAMLVIHGMSKSPLADWITEEPKLRDFIPPVFKMFEGNSNPVEHIFQFQQKNGIGKQQRSNPMQSFLNNFN